MQYIETNQNNVLMFTTNRAAQNNTAAHKRCAVQYYTTIWTRNYLAVQLQTVQYDTVNQKQYDTALNNWFNAVQYKPWTSY